MPTLTIRTDPLNAPGAREYFMKTEHRAACFRATLDLLGIPLPIWAHRLPSGRKPSISVEVSFRADNPETLPQATMRRQRELSARLPSRADPLACAPLDMSIRT